MSNQPSLEEINQVMKEADLLTSPSQVEEAIDKLALQISEELADKNPVVFSVMNGALVFSGQLLTRLNFPLEVGYMHATRYRGELEGQPKLHWQAPPSVAMESRNVLILDDVYDEGHTLYEIVNSCKSQQAKEVYTAVLVDKLHDNKVEGLDIDFVGLEVENRYIFGSGMDYRGYWRNAAGIYALKGK